MIDENGKQYEICIVGNVIGDHYWGEKIEIRNGTKHFRASAKVYCAFIYGGMGNEDVLVMGKPRKSFRMIKIVIRTSTIKNFRLQKVYAPGIIEFIRESKENIFQKESFVESLNQSENEEIKS